MATQTTKARDRQIKKTLDAIDRMIHGIPNANVSEPHTDSLTEKPQPKCPECGVIGRPNCCWYSRRIAEHQQSHPNTDPSLIERNSV